MIYLSLVRIKKIMEKNDLRILMSVEDRVIAEDIQNILEESEIYTMLVSDNPASSILITYTGFNPGESIAIQINKNDYELTQQFLYFLILYLCLIEMEQVLGLEHALAVALALGPVDGDANHPSLLDSADIDRTLTNRTLGRPRIIGWRGSCRAEGR